MAMRDNVAADGTPFGSKKRRRLSPWSPGVGVDLERSDDGGDVFARADTCKEAAEGRGCYGGGGG